MKYTRIFLLVALVTCFVTDSFSQRRKKGNFDIVNGVGIFGGITQINILTDNFVTKEGSGFIGGFNATVDLPHRWYNLSYTMQLSQSTVSILGRPTVSSTVNEFIDYNLFAAQLSLMGHVKLIDTYLTLDGGPMVQYNSTLENDNEGQEGYFINNYDNLIASNIANISQFNVNGTIGFTAGYKFIKLRAHYIYGLTNMLKKLDNEDIDTSGGDSSFKGNMSMLVFGAMFSF